MQCHSMEAKGIFPCACNAEDSEQIYKVCILKSTHSLSRLKTGHMVGEPTTLEKSFALCVPWIDNVEELKNEFVSTLRTHKAFYDTHMQEFYGVNHEESQPLMAQAHRLGGREVQPSRWWQLMVRLRGMAIPDGAGSQGQPVAASGMKHPRLHVTQHKHASSLLIYTDNRAGGSYR